MVDMPLRFVKVIVVSFKRFGGMQGGGGPRVVVYSGNGRVGLSGVEVAMESWMWRS